MTLGDIVGVITLAGAFAAAAIRKPGTSWAVIAVFLVLLIPVTIARSGLDSTFITNADDGAVIVGAFLLAGVVRLGMGLPESLEDRLLLGDRLPAWAFDQAIIRARQPFGAAAQAGDESATAKAHWRHTITVPAPSSAWASLADALADDDGKWMDRQRFGVLAEDWQPSQARTAELAATWDALRGPAAERRRRRAAIVRGVFSVGTLAAAVCLVIGFGNVATGITSGAPGGRAAIVPVNPPGRTVYLAPLGGLAGADLQDLAAFYKVRYDLDVGILPPAPIPASLEDAGRHQLAAEDLIGLLPSIYPEAADPNSVVIGVLPGDIYSRGIPDWQWAFSKRASGHLAVVSTTHMIARGPFGTSIAAARLRKMVTRNIGVLYFGLPLSDDARSVLYYEILSVADLDRLGEDF